MAAAERLFYSERETYHPEEPIMISNQSGAAAACTALTRAGRACTARALPGTQPPTCGRHRPRTPDAPTHLYQSGLTREELLLLTGPDAAADLSAELALVRAVLMRLLARLDDPAYVLLPSDLRQLAGLIFSGARTVAQLLRQHQSEAGESQAWLDQALDELAASSGIEL